MGTYFLEEDCEPSASTIEARRLASAVAIPQTFRVPNEWRSRGSRTAHVWERDVKREVIVLPRGVAICLDRGAKCLDRYYR